MPSNQRELENRIEYLETKRLREADGSYAGTLIVAKIDQELAQLRKPQAQERRQSPGGEDMSKRLEAQLAAARSLLADLVAENARLKVQATAAKDPPQPGFVPHGRTQVYASAEDYVAQRLGLTAEDVEAYGSDEIVGVAGDGSLVLRDGRKIRRK